MVALPFKGCMLLGEASPGKGIILLTYGNNMLMQSRDAQADSKWARYRNRKQKEVGDYVKQLEEMTCKQKQQQIAKNCN